MKLKTLAKIEKVIKMVFFVVLIPFVILLLVSSAIRWIIAKTGDWIADLEINIDNRLLRCSDEVKNGIINNKDVIRTYSASLALKHFIKEKQEEKEL